MIASFGERNSCFPSKQVPHNILLSGDTIQLCKWLSKLSIEVRKKDGEHYPPKTIQHYLLGIQRYIRFQNKSMINFMYDNDFVPLRTLLDSLYRKLHCSVKKTQVLTDSEEENSGPVEY